VAVVRNVMKQVGGNVKVTFQHLLVILHSYVVAWLWRWCVMLWNRLAVMHVCSVLWLYGWFLYFIYKCCKKCNEYCTEYTSQSVIQVVWDVTLHNVTRLTHSRIVPSAAPARELHVSHNSRTWVFRYGDIQSFEIDCHVVCLIVTFVLEDLVAFILRVFLFLEDGAETSPS